MCSPGSGQTRLPLVDQTVIPSELGVSDDARELGVRVLTVYVEPI